MTCQPLLNKRVLIVEDEMLVGLDLKEMLLDSGCTVIGPCPSIKKAMDLLEEQDAIDVAVLDVNLRGTYVFPLASHLQDIGVPIIFASGYEATNLPKDFQQTRIISKPYSKSECIEALCDTVT